MSPASQKHCRPGAYVRSFGCRPWLRISATCRVRQRHADRSARHNTEREERRCRASATSPCGRRTMLNARAPSPPAQAMRANAVYVISAGATPFSRMYAYTCCWRCVREPQGQSSAFQVAACHCRRASADCSGKTRLLPSSSAWLPPEQRCSSTLNVCTSSDVPCAHGQGATR